MIAVPLLPEQLYALGHITEGEDSAFCKWELQGSNIYFLLKVHKEMEKSSRTVPGWPIGVTLAAV